MLTYIVNVDIVRPDVDAIKTAVITAADKHVIDLAVLARVHGEMERWAIDEFDIVHAEAVLHPSSQLSITHVLATGHNSPHRRTSAVVGQRYSPTYASRTHSPRSRPHRSS